MKLPKLSSLKGRAKYPQRKAGEMNGLERRYADRLEEALRAGRIARWDFEPEKFRLADRTYYTPDFRVVYPDGLVEFVETKGFWQDDARVKIKVVAELHPYTFKAVQWSKKAGWTEEVFA